MIMVVLMTEDCGASIGVLTTQLAPIERHVTRVFPTPRQLFIRRSPQGLDVFARLAATFSASWVRRPNIGVRLYHRSIDADATSAAARGVSEVNSFIAKIVAWINAGYPEGVPGPDRVPLLALLNRRLSDDEVKAVAQGLIDRGEFDHVDIGVLITQTTDELPLPEDVERVRVRLAAKGWPLDDAREDEASSTDRGDDSP
jgi:hypothetical protein